MDDRASGAPVPGQSGLQLSGARSFVRDHLGREVIRFEMVGEGAWSRCFGFTDGGRDLVVRFGRHLDDFEKDRRAHQLVPSSAPVPEVVEIGEAFDGWFVIVERARGSFLEDAGVAQWSTLLPSVLSTLDDLRAVDLAQTDGWGVWSAGGNAPYPSWPEFLLSVADDTPNLRTHGWRPKLAASTGGDAAFGAALDRLAALSENLTVDRHLVHADLLHANVLVAGSEVTAVLDWGCSLYGDSLYDVAWMAFWVPWHPGVASVDIVKSVHRHLTSARADVVDFDRRLQCCLLHIGLDHIAYNAHMERWEELTRVTAVTRALVDD